MISKSTAEHYTWGAACDGWHLVRQAALSVIHDRMPPSSSEARHLHRHARQFFFILSGTATIEVAGTRETLEPQPGVEVPPGAPHQIFNETNADLEFIVISQPSSHGDRVLADPENHS